MTDRRPLQLITTPDDNHPIPVMEPLSDEAIAVIRHDDQRTTHQQKLADRTRLLWDRHCLLAEVDRLRALLAEQNRQDADE